MRVRNKVYQGEIKYTKNKNTPEKIKRIQHLLADIITEDIKKRQGL